MTSRTPAPTGRALALIWTGGLIALAGSIVAMASGHRWLMSIAAVGFALQFAGWVVNGRRMGGSR